MPDRLSHEIRPPINSTSCLEMARPSPVPPNSRVVDSSAWVKGLNNRSQTSFSIPIPVSLTEKRTFVKAFFSSRVCTRTRIVPLLVNLRALESRFKRTWRILKGSAFTKGEPSCPMSTISVNPLLSAWPAMMSTVSLTRLSRLQGVDSSASFPASILVKSRISLMMSSKESPDTFMVFISFF